MARSQGSWWAAACAWTGRTRTTSGAGCTIKARRGNPHYFGFDGARTRLLRFFPGGFGSAAYTEAERDYKIAAKRKLAGRGHDTYP
ncbi:MAG TPA: hypothetical protein VGS12_16190 [Caulobacteraceae bacterium]|nr:hypothetical protein [Caulobacteraceae bacterium]